MLPYCQVWLPLGKGTTGICVWRHTLPIPSPHSRDLSLPSGPFSASYQQRRGEGHLSNCMCRGAKENQPDGLTDGLSQRFEDKAGQVGKCLVLEGVPSQAEASRRNQEGTDRRVLSRTLVLV